MKVGVPLTMLSHMMEASERIVTQIVEETKGEKYDYLIYDNHFPVGRIIANVLKLPSVSSCTTFAFNQYITFNDEHESREVDETNPLYQSCLAGMEKWNKQYGMKCNSMYDIMNHPGDITIVYTSKNISRVQMYSMNRISLLAHQLLLEKKQVAFLWKI